MSELLIGNIYVNIFLQIDGLLTTPFLFLFFHIWRKNCTY